MGRLWRVPVLSLLLISVRLAWGDTEISRAQSGHNPPVFQVETAGDDLPAKDDTWNFWYFLYAHRGRWAYLDDVHVGAFGEFIGKPTRGIGAYRAMKVYQFEGGLLLCASEDIPSLSMKLHDRFAYVDPGGKVTSLVSDRDIAAKLSSMPRRWPVSLQDGRPRALEPGEILFNPTPNYSTDGDLPPAGNLGWIMPGIEGVLFVPREGDTRPENVLWVVPQAQGGFKLVWGGPKRCGELMMAVARTGKVTLGENTPYSLESRQGGPKRWVLSHDGEAAMIPPGYCMGPLTDGTSDAWLSEDGEVRWTITRY